MPRDPVLRCPNCRANALDIGAEAARCAACEMRYPVVNGIPMLVRDPAMLARDIEEARRVNPAWYEAEQPPEMASPWRHHLKKRRLYVERVLTRELAARGRSKGVRLLDLGCGDGNNLTWLARYADSIYGSDYNVLRLARARKRCPEARLFLGNILDFPLIDDVFDIIFFNHVIEHIPDDGVALATVARILRPDGFVILGTPNEGAWWWQIAYRRAPDFRASTDHVHFYTADTIAAKMCLAGLKVIEIEHLGWGPPDWRLDGRIRKYKSVDDAFEFVGRRLLPSQASSLYLIATRGIDAPR